MRLGITLLPVLICMIGLTGCGSAGKNLLNTGSIFGGKSDKVAAGGPVALAKPETPQARAIQVGWVSARASRCGFYFDPARLKQQYLDHEVAAGYPAANLRKLDLTYELARKSIHLKVTDNPDYCTDARALAIRKDLQRHLAGDYTPTPRKKKPVGDTSFWSGGHSVPEKFDQGKILKNGKP